ncbi:MULTISPECIES: winged helix-turn-helix domain-containing protein [Citricoccus]|uniref:winged helix-turn-helix domain-containing protein n=1 Tax=Citricoccus TaxID=169133 RepID=UPI000255F259|nr:helix-turn-helix domain-containing protein [Citricoccus sp. CH26A]
MPRDKSSAPGDPLPDEAPRPSPDPVADGPAQLPGVAPRKVDARAMKAFAHPLRMSIYSHLTDVGSATATALARHLDESTGQTSYHLRQLEKHGFVEEDTGRGSGRERWWKPVGFAVPTYDLAQDEANRPAIQALLQASLDQRAAALGRWLSVENHEDREWIEASIDNTTTRELTAAQTRALTEELMTVIDRHLGRPGDPSGADGDAGAPPDRPTSDEDPAAQTRRVRLYLSVFPLAADDTTP